MKAPRLYVNNPSLAVDQPVELAAEAAKYLIRVLRRNVGDPLILFNGDGCNYTATILSADRQTVVKITGKTDNHSESPLSITLVQSLAKGTKLDLVIQKATELGVQRIVPVSSERSVMQIEAKRQQKKHDHWHGVAISAATQCGRSTIPVIDAPASLEHWLTQQVPDGLLLHPGGTQSISQIELSTSSCTLLIGPEGGFSEQELTLATQSGYRAINCGPRVLRTETAGLTAAASLQSRFGDF